MTNDSPSSVDPIVARAEDYRALTGLPAEKNVYEAMAAALNGYAEKYIATHGNRITGVNGEAYELVKNGNDIQIKDSKGESKKFDAQHESGAAMIIMDAAMQDELDPLKLKRDEKIRAAQLKLAGDFANITGASISDIQTEISNANGTNTSLREDIRVRLDRLTGGKNKDAVDYYTTHFLALRLMQGIAAQSNFFPEDAASPEQGQEPKNRSLLTLAALSDFVTGQATAEVGHALRGVREPTKEDWADLPRPRHHFFANDKVYDAVLKNRDMVILTGADLGAAYDKTGADGKPVTYSEQDICDAALERLKASVLEQGHELTDLTRLMFEGRFNPPIEDIQLAFKSRAMGSLASNWNRTFGDIQSLDKVKTISFISVPNPQTKKDDMKPAEVVVSGADILADLKERLLINDPRIIANLNHDWCAASVFGLSYIGSELNRDFKQRYRLLEEEYYKKLAGLNPGNPDDVLRDAARNKPDFKPVPQPTPKPEAAAPSVDEKLQQCVVNNAGICATNYQGVDPDARDFVPPDRSPAPSSPPAAR